MPPAVITDAAPAEGHRAGVTVPAETIPFAVARTWALSGPRGAVVATDPVVQHLSLALEAAERSGDAFAGLYADALRLAVMARTLGQGTLGQGTLGQGTLGQGTLAQSALDDGQPLPAQAPRPDGAPARSMPRIKSGLVAWRLKRVMAFIEAHLAEPVTLTEMAEAAGLSRMHFAAQFRRATGLRPHQFLLKRRIEWAQDLLRDTRDPLVQIALAVGFQTQAHFTTVFRRFVGDTPYQWRCANAGRR
ncbi:AraC family transcriptional regulator [Xanthobacter autotrophicus]|uniref:AraC family transcriptional regulator n=1 Tax=Xanthobacter autotrophicus TaxID=280 RepID=UPI0024A73504|nr:AraC family transcriptional regulator [Xanthobacter autotrophicus]MDI4657621.1 AraC family transcriptional regulator [Xanthobacter autotrophicus]